jgi:hypothetical protein
LSPERVQEAYKVVEGLRFALHVVPFGKLTETIYEDIKAGRWPEAKTFIEAGGELGGFLLLPAGKLVKIIGLVLIGPKLYLRTDQAVRQLAAGKYGEAAATGAEIGLDLLLIYGSAQALKEEIKQGTKIANAAKNEVAIEAMMEIDTLIFFDKTDITKRIIYRKGDNVAEKVFQAGAK